MCSIGGWIATKPLPSDLAEMLAAALLWNGKVRGAQSAGIYVGGKVLKKAVHPKDLIFTDEFAKMFEGNDTSICLTHTRQPTSGGTADPDAQPFMRGDVATVHNGGFFDCENIKERFGIRKETNVDSELVTAYAESYGVEMLPEFLEYAQGSAAIAAATAEGKLYLVRTNGSLAYQCLLPPGNEILIFASTTDILAKAMRYCWLLEDHVRGYEIGEQQLFEATPKGIVASGKKFGRPPFRSVVTVGSGGNSGCSNGSGQSRSYGDDRRWLPTHYQQQELGEVREKEKKSTSGDVTEARSREYWRQRIEAERYVQVAPGVWAPPTVQD